jgi:hypothetical protein
MVLNLKYIVFMVITNFEKIMDLRKSWVVKLRIIRKTLKFLPLKTTREAKPLNK